MKTDAALLPVRMTLVLAVVFCAHAAVGQTTTRSVTLTVSNQPRQTLDGFGCSMVDLSRSKMPNSARSEMFDRVFGDLHMNVLRLWAGADTNCTVAQVKATFYRTYADTGVIADAQKRGVTTLLLAPARSEKPPSEPMPEYARKLAEFIQGVKSERGIRINVTGIANEPSGFKPDQMAEAVRGAAPGTRCSQSPGRADHCPGMGQRR